MKPDWAERIQRSRIRKYQKGYADGYVTGARETSDFVRRMIIKNILNDAVLTTNTDTLIIERVVEIVEES